MVEDVRHGIEQRTVGLGKRGEIKTPDVDRVELLLGDTDHARHLDVVHPLVGRVDETRGAQDRELPLTLVEHGVVPEARRQLHQRRKGRIGVRERAEDIVLGQRVEHLARLRRECLRVRVGAARHRCAHGRRHCGHGKHRAHDSFHAD